MVTPLKSRYDQRIDKQFEEINATIDSCIQKGDYESVTDIFNYTIKGTTDVINYKYSKYELMCLEYKKINEEKEDSDLKKASVLELKKELKALKKELYDEIGLLKKLNSKGNQVCSTAALESKINTYITQLENRSQKYKILNMLIKLSKYFPSISFSFSTKELITLANQDYDDADPILESYNQLTNLRNLQTNITPILNADNKHIEKIEKGITENRNLIEKTWRPEKITKESLKSRITEELLENIKPTLAEESGINELKKQINDLDFNDCLCSKGITKLNENFDLIVTSKNNYYLVLKNVKLGKGGMKTVYTGIDLSKSNLVAISYANSRTPKEFEEICQEELNYLDIKGSDNVIKIKDFLINKDQSTAIFISELHSNGEATDENLKKSKIIKHEFCKELINLVYSIEKKGFPWSDCKNENIVINKKLNPVIIDLTKNNITTYHAAPELFRNNAPSRDEASRVWSLGITLYRIFYGSFFEDDDIKSDQDIINSDQNIINSDQNIINSDQNIINSDQNIIKGLLQLTPEQIDGQFDSDYDPKIDPENFPFLELIRIMMLHLDPEERVDLHTIKIAWELTSSNLWKWKEILSKINSDQPDTLSQLIDAFNNEFYPMIKDKINETINLEQQSLEKEQAWENRIALPDKLLILEKELDKLHNKLQALGTSSTFEQLLTVKEGLKQKLQDLDVLRQELNQELEFLNAEVQALDNPKKKLNKELDSLQTKPQNIDDLRQELKLIKAEKGLQTRLETKKERAEWLREKLTPLESESARLTKALEKELLKHENRVNQELSRVNQELSSVKAMAMRGRIQTHPTNPSGTRYPYSDSAEEDPIHSVEEDPYSAEEDNSNSDSDFMGFKVLDE